MRWRGPRRPNTRSAHRLVQGSALQRTAQTPRSPQAGPALSFSCIPPRYISDTAPLLKRSYVPLSHTISPSCLVILLSNTLFTEHFKHKSLLHRTLDI